MVCILVRKGRKSVAIQSTHHSVEEFLMDIVWYCLISFWSLLRIWFQWTILDGPRCVQADLQTPAPRSAKKKGFLHARLRTQAYPLCPMEWVTWSKPFYKCWPHRTSISYGFPVFFPYRASKMMSDISNPIKTREDRRTGSPSHRQCPRTTGLAIIDGRRSSASAQTMQLHRCRHGSVAPFKLHVGKLESKNPRIQSWHMHGKLHVPHSVCRTQRWHHFVGGSAQKSTKFQQWLHHGATTIFCWR